MYHSLFRSSASILITAFLSCIVLFSAGQKDSVYHIGLILPLQVEDNIDKLNTIATARDLYTANRVNFDEDATIALGFYQGLVEALSTNKDSVRVALSVYDCGGLDSITALLLQKPELKRQDVIIGPVATSNAKLVADFCRDNKIVNIQPFTPSKSWPLPSMHTRIISSIPLSIHSREQISSSILPNQKTAPMWQSVLTHYSGTIIKRPLLHLQ